MQLPSSTSSDEEAGVDGALSRAEAFLAERRDELLTYAAELIATPSINPPGDERQVAQLAADRLRELGASDVQIHEAAPNRHNVIATFTGTKAGPVLLLNGHLDTKPAGDPAHWLTPPFEPTVNDGMLIGLGAADMKGAVAAITYAAGAVAAAGVGGTLTVVFNADEEAGGAYGSKWLADRGLLRADACMIAEPCGVHEDWDRLRLVSRGVAIFRVAVRGTQMHSSLSEELPSINANLEMAKLMVRMSAAASTMLRFTPHALDDQGPTFNIGLHVQGGIGYGVLPGSAEFLCDVRALPGMTAESIEADVRAFIASVEAEDPDLHTEFEMLNWTPPAEIASDHALVTALQQAAESVLGVRPPLGIFPGGTDAPFFNLAGIATVPAFGPGLLPHAHAPNEAVSTESILNAARIYAIAATTFLS
jgi:acetylornithine deacetylase/succinyl-diaminopimelate desuccinylase family protein